MNLRPAQPAIPAALRESEPYRAAAAWLRPREHEVIDLLRDLVAIPSHDGEIGAVGAVVADRMRALGFSDVHHDPMGNLLGRVGRGPRTLLLDCHLDTVAPADRDAWVGDPFVPRLDGGVLYGLGVGDAKAMTPSALYGLAALAATGAIDGALADWSLWYFGNVEEWCEGSSGRALVATEGWHPDYVIVGESTGMRISIGQRGRVEIVGRVRGRAGHGSAPERADSAIDKALPVLDAIRRLNTSGRLPQDDLLGPGTVAVTRLRAEAGSANVIPDLCTFLLDRRLTRGETAASAIAELRSLPEAIAAGATFDIPTWSRTSSTGYVSEQPLVFPAWLTPAETPFVEAARVAAGAALAVSDPVPVGHWSFSTNGVFWAGELNIPTVGFGPGDERFAHTVQDQVPTADVIAAARVYAAIALATGDIDEDGRGKTTSAQRTSSPGAP